MTLSLFLQAVIVYRPEAVISKNKWITHQLPPGAGDEKCTFLVTVLNALLYIQVFGAITFLVKPWREIESWCSLEGVALGVGEAL